MKKAVKIVFGVLGALGIGLVGLILACHFNPGLSDSIAGKLYKDKAGDTVAVNTESADSEDATDDVTADMATDITDNGDNPAEPAGDAQTESETPPTSDTPADFKTLEDYGFTQADVLNSLTEYFEDCFEQLSEGKGEDISFNNVVIDQRLAEEVLNSYDNESYRPGFMNQFMDDYKVDACGWTVDQEELMGGYVLVTHSFVR